MSNDALTVTRATAPAAKATQRRTEEVASDSNAVQASRTQAAQRAEMQEQLKQATQQLEAYLRSSGRSLEFRVDEGSGRTVVTVRDAQSGEVIRQMPSEEVLRLAQLAQGDSARLLNEKV